MATSAEVTSGAAPGQDRVQEFLERVIIDAGAAVAGLCTSLGDRLGLYTAMAGAGPLVACTLAVLAHTPTRQPQGAALRVLGEAILGLAKAPPEKSSTWSDPSSKLRNRGIREA
ncbi:hypothetical protein [Streptomyces sp. NRRL S-1813]|uniref:hypothetical protein n=1 Tax=Streptomyces sp. NRRL S-1813 TaxID=1463888 RepID=UPI0004CBAE6C|nr:hypothetical protein [Streptomyces sp. NRRL S-1813]